MSDNNSPITLKTTDIKNTTLYLNKFYNWKYINVYLYKKTPQSIPLTHNNYLTRFYQNNQTIIPKQIK
jgi:hypothetical protein